MTNYRGRRYVDPDVRHEHNQTFYTDELYQIDVEYVGEGTNTADDRMQAAAFRTVAALRTTGRRIAFHNWYMSYLNRNPL